MEDGLQSDVKPEASELGLRGDVESIATEVGLQRLHRGHGLNGVMTVWYNNGFSMVPR